jgi:flagellar basal-body rod protein FlgC
MFSAIDISTSALVAQRTRLNAIASNIANLSTTHNEAGEAAPYLRRFAVFQTEEHDGAPQGAAGVRVSSVEIEPAEPRWKYQPGHPDAVKEGPRQGWVAYPNIDMTTEFVDSLNATRAYEANVGAIEITKDLTQQTLKILA